MAWLYADIIGLQASDKNPYDVENLINLDLDNICNWLFASRLIVNVRKTKCMIFASRFISDRPYIKNLWINIKQVDERINPILPGLLNTFPTGEGAYFTPPPNSLIFYPRNIKFDM